MLHSLQTGNKLKIWQFVLLPAADQGQKAGIIVEFWAKMSFMFLKSVLQHAGLQQVSGYWLTPFSEISMSFRLVPVGNIR